MLEALYQTDDALEHLRAVTARSRRSPHSSLALAYLQLGEAHDRLGARAAAVAAYKSAVAAVPPLDPHDVRGQAHDRIRRAPDAKRAEALSPVARRLAAPRAQRPAGRDGRARAGDRARSRRSGRALPLRPRAAGAPRRCRARSRSSSSRSAARAAVPRRCSATPTSKRRACTSGSATRDDAISHYKIAASLFGAAADTRAAAARALARLGAR